jgi:hypothetical protein
MKAPRHVGFCPSAIPALMAALWVLPAGRPAFAVNPNQPFSNYIRTHFTTDERSPASVVTASSRHQDGFLWDDRERNYLTRFDGRQFRGFDGVFARARSQSDPTEICGSERKEGPPSGFLRTSLSGFPILSRSHLLSYRPLITATAIPIACASIRQ